MNEDDIARGIVALGCLGVMLGFLVKVVVPIAVLIAIVVWMLK